MSLAYGDTAASPFTNMILQTCAPLLRNSRTPDLDGILDRLSRAVIGFLFREDGSFIADWAPHFPQRKYRVNGCIPGLQMPVGSPRKSTCGPM